MARPTKFNPERGEMIVAALRAGHGRPAAAAAAGVTLRTLAGWLAKGRAGDPALAEWARRAQEAERAAFWRRWRERCERQDAAARDRWLRFKASREGWWLDRLGPCEFWTRRLRWLEDRGHARAYAATVARIEAEGFCINLRP